MDKPFFVMLLNQHGTHAEPIVDENEETMFYESRKAAEDAMENHYWAGKWGYEIFELRGNR